MVSGSLCPISYIKVVSYVSLIMGWRLRRGQSLLPSREERPQRGPLKCGSAIGHRTLPVYGAAAQKGREEYRQMKKVNDGHFFGRISFSAGNDRMSL